MHKPTRRNAIVYGLYCNAVLLAGILLLLASRGVNSSGQGVALGQQQQPIAAAAALFVVPAQFSANTWGCYLVDVEGQTLVAYQYSPGDRQLRLVAARNFTYDRRLSNFNTSPAPEEIKKLIEDAQKPLRGTETTREVGQTPGRDKP